MPINPIVSFTSILTLPELDELLGVAVGVIVDITTGVMGTVIALVGVIVDITIGVMAIVFFLVGVMVGVIVTVGSMTDSEK